MSIDRQKLLKCAIMLAEYAMYLRTTGKDGAFSADYLSRMEMAESGRDYLISLLAEEPDSGKPEFPKVRKVTVHADAAEEEPEAERNVWKPESRVERMFGARETQETGTGTENVPYWKQGMVKGFVLMKCDSCGGIHANFWKTPQKQWRCPKCGNENEVHRDDMRIAFVNCECGNDLEYKTNLNGEPACIICNRCGKKVNLRLDFS